MKLLDNVNSRLADDLKASIRKGSRLSIAASSFSIYAFEALKKELEKIEELRFIFTSPTFIEENFKKEVPRFFIPHLFKEADLCGGEFELRLKNQLNQRAIARECSRWVKEKVTFKSNKHLDRAIPGMIHLKNSLEEEYAYSMASGPIQDLIAYRKQVSALEKEIARLKSSIANSKKFKDKVELNLKLKATEDKLQSLLFD